MNWKLVIIILLFPLYALYWVALEPFLTSKSPKLKRNRLLLSIVVSLIFLDILLLLLRVSVDVVLIFSAVIILGVLLSLSYSAHEGDEDIKLDIRERDLILWEGENVEVRSVNKDFISAISDSGEFIIPVKVVLSKGVKKLRRVLPRKVEFSLFFPVEIYTNLLTKLHEFMKSCTHVLVSPEFQVEFVSVALNEVEVKVTFFTENLNSEQAFWDEFFVFLDKEKLNINRIVKHGKSETYGW